jgi:uncharacterized protein YegP (UPF0339 family)
MTGLVVVGASLPTAPAQDKKDTKVDPKKDTKAGTVEIYRDRAGDYRFRIKDTEGKVIAMPPKGFDTREECHKVLDLIKATLNTTKPVEIKDEKK